jgi:hypothetical protein
MLNPDVIPSPHKARVLFDKAQNFVSAFLVEITAIRKQIGDDDKFASWCFNDLQIGVSAITRLADALDKVDAEIAKRALVGARAAEEAQLAAQRREREAAAAADRKRRDDEKAAAAAEKARKEQDAKKQERRDKGKKHRATDKGKEAKRKNNAGWKAKLAGEKKAALLDLAASINNGNIVPFPISATSATQEDLVKEIKQSEQLMHAGRDQWIIGAVRFAAALCEARRRYPAHLKFSNWLDENNIKLDSHDRAALLNLGLNPPAMAVLLADTDRTSFKHIWRDTEHKLTELNAAKQRRYGHVDKTP